MIIFVLKIYYSKMFCMIYERMRTDLIFWSNKNLGWTWMDEASANTCKINNRNKINLFANWVMASCILFKQKKFL